jgi:hypothetical protein
MSNLISPRLREKDPIEAENISPALPTPFNITYKKTIVGGKQ